MFSITADNGGGVGSYSWSFGRKSVEDGIGKDIILPKIAMFVIHFEDRRGSRVNATADQYL